MTEPSRNVVEALDRIANQLERSPYPPDLTGGPLANIPDLTVVPHEKLYVLSAAGKRTLHGQFPPKKNSLWYYHLKGTFTELTGAIEGTGEIEAVLSWFPSEVGLVVLDFPDPSLGKPPFDRPLANGYKGVKTNADTLGHTKTRLAFPDGSTIVSFGVNQTKIAPYADGSAQLFETNTEVTVTGTGKFKGARGLVTSDMGAFFNPRVPLDPTKEPYKSGFPVKVLVCIRLVTEEKP
jgi:hypothetical protein